MEKAKKMAWHLLAASVGLLTLSQLAHADSLDEQRSRYAQIKQAWDNRQMDVVDQLMPTLSTYPLYPYLQYRQITDDLMNQPALVVKNFIDANPTLPPARSLRSRFVNELARRSDWRGLLAFSPDKPTSTEAQCNYYYAKLSVGQSQEAWSGAKELWLTGKNQPGACEPLFSAWRDSGQQDPLAYLERIRLAMKAGNIGLVKSLAQQMPGNYQSIASAVVAVSNSGERIPEEALPRLFEPFFRVDSSRNRETGGIGLGLALARAIVEEAGGEIALSNRANGGLRADITLPLMRSAI